MIKKILLKMLKLYKNYISPLIPGCCRFHPTCSAYAMEALERFGVSRGLILAFLRIIRCNPLFKGGIDPVPEYFMGRSCPPKQ